MALQPKQPGSNIIGAFSLGLAEAPDLGEEFLPNSSYHLPAYTLSLKDLNNLKDGQSIDDVAREVAWQCVAVSKNAPDETAVIGEVTPQHQAPRPAGQVFDGPLRMTSLSHGEVIDGAYKIAKDLHARKDDLAKKYKLADDYEPRMLRIPGLLVTSVWLKSKKVGGGTDWVLPVHTKIAALSVKDKEMYTMGEFLTITKSLAEKRLASPIFD
jgi:hypothetical protein